MIASKKLIANAARLYAAQAAIALIQIIYAGAVSRVVNSREFAAYAVALSVTGLVNLLATGGLGQAAGRLQDGEINLLHSLLSYSVVIGAASGTFVLVTANLWASLWGVSSAAGAIRLLAVSAAFAPTLGLASGLARRNHHYRFLSTANFLTSAAGFALGYPLVRIMGSSDALVAPIVLSQTLLLASLWIRERSELNRFASLRYARSQIAFGTQVIRASMVAYLCVSLPYWSVSRWFGSNALGQMNRADVVTTSVFYQVNLSILQTLYPEYRHLRPGSPAARTFISGVISIAAVLAWPAAAVLSGVSTLIIPILFGHQWPLASELSVPLAISAGVYFVAVLLASALEAHAHFRLAWVWHGVRLFSVVASVAAGVIYQNIHLMLYLLSGSLCVSLAVMVLVTGRAGIVEIPTVLRNFCQGVWLALVASVPLTLFQSQSGGITFTQVAIAVASTSLASWLCYVGIKASIHTIRCDLARISQRANHDVCLADASSPAAESGI